LEVNSINAPSPSPLPRGERDRVRGKVSPIIGEASWITILFYKNGTPYLFNEFFRHVI
jgi:hypothetical protein